ncbi:nucleotide exchange factor GrpE [Candidatus Peregrinibacteria bacterium]|nr:nucleotide exchange factor GrpE [Candidatus Peregrinibacteria bacterium]
MTTKPPTKKELEIELSRLKEMAARAQADLQNAKDRLQREAEEFRRYAAEGVMRRLLPTIDNFQRAIKHVPDDLKNNEWAKGVVAMEQELLRQLNEAGLKRMESLGNIVDPTKHEVLMTGPGEEGKVIEVFEEGYMLHDKILRIAKVKVGGFAPTDQTPPPVPQNS